MRFLSKEGLLPVPPPHTHPFLLRPVALGALRIRKTSARCQSLTDRMDIVIQVEDYLFFDALYQTASPDWLGQDRENVYRQFISIYITVATFGVLLYGIFSGLDWFFFFDRAYLNDPKILPNQVRREIMTTLGSIPFMTLLTTPVFLAEVRKAQICLLRKCIRRCISDHQR